MRKCDRSFSSICANVVGRSSSYHSNFWTRKRLTLAVKEIEGKISMNSTNGEDLRFFSAADLSAVARGQPSKARKVSVGVTLPNTMVVFERAEGSAINLAWKIERVNFSSFVDLRSFFFLL